MMIELPEKLEAALRDRAKARGVSLDGYVVEVLERDLAAAPWMHRDSASEDRDYADAERRWLAQHQGEFKGRCVALRGSRLLASGPSAIGVYRSARGLGEGVPYVAYVEEGEALPFAGW